MQVRQALDEVRKMMNPTSVAKLDRTITDLLDKNQLSLRREYKAEFKGDIDIEAEMDLLNLYFKLRKKSPNELLDRSFSRELFFIKLRRQKTLDDKRKFLAEEVKKAHENDNSSPGAYNRFLCDCLIVFIKKRQDPQLADDILAQHPVFSVDEMNADDSVWHAITSVTPEFARHVAQLDSKQSKPPHDPFDTPTRETKETPIFSAVGNRNFAMFQFLLSERKASFRTRNNQGNNLLHHLLSTFHVEEKDVKNDSLPDQRFARELVSLDSAMADQVNEKGESPLYLALKKGDLRLARILIWDAGATFYPDRFLTIPDLIRQIAEGNREYKEDYEPLKPPNPFLAMHAAALVLVYSNFRYSHRDQLTSDDYERLQDLLSDNLLEVSTNDKYDFFMNQLDLPVCLLLWDRANSYQLFTRAREEAKSDHLKRLTEELRNRINTLQQQKLSKDTVLQVALYCRHTQSIPAVLSVPMSLQLVEHIKDEVVRPKLINHIYEFAQIALAIVRSDSDKDLDLNPILKELLRIAIARNDSIMLEVLTEHYMKYGKRELFFAAFDAITRLDAEMKVQLNPKQLTQGIKQGLSIAVIPESKKLYPQYLEPYIKDELATREKDITINTKISSKLEQLCDAKMFTQISSLLAHAPKNEEKVPRELQSSLFVTLWLTLKKEAPQSPFAMQLLVNLRVLIKAFENEDFNAFSILFACAQFCEKNKVPDDIKKLYLNLLEISASNNLQEFRHKQPLVLAKIAHECNQFGAFLAAMPQEMAMLDKLSQVIFTDAVVVKTSKLGILAAQPSAPPQQSKGQVSLNAKKHR